MADWKQITARIRRARSGKDPVGQLSTLYEKTRDAMVAFELARLFETSGQNSDAAKWYIAAAERFRRADWKTKAQEAAVRLGAELSAASSAPSESPSSPAASPAAEMPLEPPSASVEPLQASSSPEIEDASANLAGESSGSPEKKRRRRGRRGGRNRRRADSHREPASASSERDSEPSSTSSASASKAARKESPESESRRVPHPRAIPELPVESATDLGAATVRGRSGDPGLSSRLSLLEMQLRRLLTCAPAKLGQADHAPAGPGVLVLTDSDLTSYYYVEACQTLRIAVASLLRGGSTHRGVESIKPRLAEHLGIPEARVSKYLADHCVVRWLQLDEGASYFAHFVIAVLRPTLND